MFGDGPQRGHFGLRPPAAADLLASKVRWHPAKISRTLWPLGLIWRSLLSRSRKGQRRFGGFDQKIIAMYAQGMTVREIQRFLEEQYKVEVSADLISTVTDSVLEDVVEWQNRPLESMYPVVFFDALRVKIRDEGSVKK